MPSKTEFEKLIAKPFPVNISLEAPRITFIISDLDQDPTKMEDAFRDFLAKTFSEDLDVSFKRQGAGQWRQSGFGMSMNPTPPPTIVPAKIKWNLSSFESQEANGKWVVTIKVPLF